MMNVVAGKYTEGSYSYDGDWADDDMHGYGTFAFASGCKFSGCWLKGKYQGIGTYSWTDGRFYEV
jgi:hypothetical protein